MALQAVPRSDIDLFSDEALTDPFPIYRELRDAGAVVYNEPLDAWVLARYHDVRWVMKEWETFTSAEGIAFNELLNMNLRGTVLGSDPPEHDRTRTVMLERLNLKSVRELVPEAEAKAGALVAELLERGSFDAVTELAQVFPPMVIGELIGLSDENLQMMVNAGDASFTMVGPLNARTEAAFEVVLPVLEMLACLERDDLAPGSMGRNIFDAAERGEIDKEMGFQLIWNYTGPAFDTTIAAIGNLVRLMADHPDQWDRLRAEPGLLTSAIDEVLRIESPIQIWGRYCRDGAEVAGVAIPPDQRLCILIGSGNRDERQYPDPDAFDVTRRPRDHLAFGHGIHTCVGMGLARLELEALVSALARRVRRFELAGDPVRRLNNSVRGFSHLPVAVTPA